MQPPSAGNIIPLRELGLFDWGIVEYGKALDRQKALVQKRIENARPDLLILAEHLPVVTIGRGGGASDLRIPNDQLRNNGVLVYSVDRGGMTTFHGPGQLIAYLIVKLTRNSLHQYLDDLHEVMAIFFEGYGLKGERKPGRPGIWVKNRKIASIGIAVRKWVTYHGIALNIANDLECFEAIVPCGNPYEQVTSVQEELQVSIDLAEAKARLTNAFCRVLGYKQPKFERKSRHPPWMIRAAPSTRAINRMEGLLHDFGLSTVCQTARCPNLGECFMRGTATFMILGARCTRRCRFCAVEKGRPEDIDPEEPTRIAEAARKLGLRHIVITSVTRDDLPDQGSEQFAHTVNCIRKRIADPTVELLIPDFKGLLNPLEQVCQAQPDILNHNVETVPRLYSVIRPGADYRRSLSILEYAARQGLHVKSGLMLGLGETDNEVMSTLHDIKRTGCRHITLGQYLSPSHNHLPVARFINPSEFKLWCQIALAMGFKYVASGPLVRSSYRADEIIEVVRDQLT